MNTRVILRAVTLICNLTICLAQSQAVGDTCITETGTNGKCVIVRDCVGVLDKIKNHERPHICYFNKLEPIVCCADSHLNKNKLIGNKSGEIAKQKCEEYFENNMLEINPEAVNGIRTLPKEFQHMAAVGFGEQSNIRWLCGGSLISDRFVLTAAHCVSSTSVGRAKWVRLGDLNLKNNTDDALPQDYEIKNSIVHPQYNRKTKRNDIALFELSHTVTMSEYVKPACLNTENTTPSPLIATGWGVTEFLGEPSDHLLKVHLRTIDYSRCNEVFKKNKIDNETQLCIGSLSSTLNMDTCQGDSGGPLQINHPLYNEYYTIVGITSYGKGCGIQNIPGIYTRVYHYIPWIENIVWPQ